MYSKRPNNISPIEFPCKNCTERHMLCHSTCERYIKADNKNKIYREQKLKELKAKNDLYDVEQSAKRRMKRTNDRKIGLYKNSKK